jgi:hypothetical protein
MACKRGFMTTAAGGHLDGEENDPKHGRDSLSSSSAGAQKLGRKERRRRSSTAGNNPEAAAAAAAAFRARIQAEDSEPEAQATYETPSAGWSRMKSAGSAFRDPWLINVEHLGVAAAREPLLIQLNNFALLGALLSGISTALLMGNVVTLPGEPAWEHNVLGLVTEAALLFSLIPTVLSTMMLSQLNVRVMDHEFMEFMIEHAWLGTITRFSLVLCVFCIATALVGVAYVAFDLFVGHATAVSFGATGIFVMWQYVKMVCSQLRVQRKLWIHNKLSSGVEKLLEAQAEKADAAVASTAGYQRVPSPGETLLESSEGKAAASFQVGDTPYTLNPYFTDGTRLREGPEGSAPFNGMHVLNDEQVEVLETLGEYAKVRVCTEGDSSARDGAAPEGWIRQRNLTKTSRSVGLPAKRERRGAVACPTPCINPFHGGGGASLSPLDLAVPIDHLQDGVGSARIEAATPGWMEPADIGAIIASAKAAARVREFRNKRIAKSSAGRGTKPEPAPPSDRLPSWQPIQTLREAAEGSAAMSARAALTSARGPSPTA